MLYHFAENMSNAIQWTESVLILFIFQTQKERELEHELKMVFYMDCS